MLLSLIAYLSIILFVGISLYQAARFTNMPMHGRMDLYPLPKEEGFEHGGSFYEEVEWWKKPRHITHGTEIIEMFKEMLFIKKLFENQRPLWWISYALHLGIYLLMAWTILLVISAIAGINSLSQGLGLLIYYLTVLTGTVGLIIAAFGSGFLFLRRLFSNTLKKYTTPQEYFNLLLIFAALVTGIFAWLAGFDFNAVIQTTGSIIHFNADNYMSSLNSIQVTNIILVAIMLSYIPMSKMSHYVGKYFTFHKVLWDNDPNLKGSEIEKKIKEASSYKPTNKWSAPHINPPASGK